MKTRFIKISIMYLIALVLGLTFAYCQTTDCGCNKKTNFSCYPDCDFVNIQSLQIPESGNELVSITPKPGYNMDVCLYFGTDSISVLNVELTEFNHNTCSLFFFMQDIKPMRLVRRNFTAVKIVDHRFGKHPDY